MARKPRKYSETGIYHVILRGINREKIFGDTYEKEKLLKILRCYFVGGQTRTPDKHQGRLFAFCILDNHVHLLLKESFFGISNLMQRIGTAYAIFYNRRHGRSGPVFESRYTSIPVEGTRYFSNALRYIHNNPVKAKIVQQPKDYIWSSMYFYLNNSTDFLMRGLTVGNLSNEDFENLMSEPYSTDGLLQCSWPTRVSDIKLIMLLNKICNTYGIVRENIIQNFNVLQKIIKQLVCIKGITKAQICRLTGIKQYKLYKILASL